ncbi:MAG TPA: hypothetical protein VF627_02080 [Abditibacterium sp.]
MKSTEGLVAAFQLKVLGACWLASFVFHVFFEHETVLEAAWGPRHFVLGMLFFIGLRLVVPRVAFLNWCNESFHRILALVPEQFPAWKAKSALTFVLFFSTVMILLFRSEAAYSWPEIIRLPVAASVSGLVLWTVMCCVDSLQKWAKTPARRAVGLVLLLLMLTLFFVVFMSGALWLMGKYA